MHGTHTIDTELGPMIPGGLGANLGSMHAHSFATDPKHLGFVLRRYHFVARMLRGCERVLEVGCGDCTGAPIVKDVVGFWKGIDTTFYLPNGDCAGSHHDMLDGPFVPSPPHPNRWDAIYALDVLEHIALGYDENRFFANINASLAEHGTVIIGSPSLESQSHASRLSKLHHVNCKSGEELCETLRRHFHSVFLLGLNDYALHDGFDAMVHYRLAICTGPK